MSIYAMKPAEIEKKSFAIITEILGRELDPRYETVIKRVIHTTADFEYADTLYFSEGVTEVIGQALLQGAPIVTDTRMAQAGINGKKIKTMGGKTHCFIADDDVAAKAELRQTTRAAVSMEKAAQLGKPAIFAIGNAPTALARLCEMKAAGQISPLAVVGVPVGFVNVVEAKELLIQSGIPCIVSRGRKGGSNVAAAIINAICYSLPGELFST